MKILISLSYYYPHISGLTLSMQHLAELLATNRYQVTVLSAQHERQLPLEENFHGVSIRRVSYLFRLSKGFIMPGFSRVAYSLLKNNDVVLIALPQAEGLLVAMLAKLLKKKVICLYICEVTVKSDRSTRTKSIVSFLRVINRLTLLFSDEIVTLTDDFNKHNDVLQKTGKKIINIYPIVLPPKIISSQQEILKLRLPHKKYYIGYLGRISSEKGIEYLLETIPFLKEELGDDFVIILAGPKKTVGEDIYIRKIETLLKKYSTYIVQLGELTNDQLGAFYSLLDVFVLPSINNTEAFGMVQVEAMYCGTPVVATDLPGVRVPIQVTGMGEIVQPQDSIALANAIIKIFQNKKNYKKSHSEVENIFSKEKIIEKYQKLFTS